MMNTKTPLAPEVARLARAIRFALASFIIALSYFPIRIVAAIQGFDQIYRDMLNGKSLPAFTTFVIHFQPLLMVCACLIPLLAAGALFSRRFVISFYVLGFLCFYLVALCIFVYQALLIPFSMIIQQMQGG